MDEEGGGLMLDGAPTDGLIPSQINNQAAAEFSFFSAPSKDLTSRDRTRV